MPDERAYEKGMRVWIPHPNNVWESAVILEDYDPDQNKLFVHTDDSRQTQTLVINSPVELPFFHLCEDSSLDIKSNLSSLMVIHEATILYHLRSRFEQNYFYSYCGICMIALNPFDQLFDNIIGNISIYQNSNLKDLNPHIFGVTKNAHTNLERENCDQTLVFTGESGAGKSVNAERAILYLTSAYSKEDQVKNKILASSVILRAFGNASTELNHDSSRFGKFIQMQYDKNYHLIGALLTTYNFDCSNITSQESHRNAFNMFYYMYAVKENHSHWELNKCKFEYFKRKTDVEAYNLYNRRSFYETMEAFDVLEFSEKEKNETLLILAVLLHLQSLTFKKIEGMKIDKSTESCTIADQNQLKTIGKILGLDEEALKTMRKWMCYKRTFCAQDEILQPMNLDQVMKARDSLVKFLYAKLFGWLVTSINASFRSPCHVQSFIGILDMHGFEKFKFNAFEQFCINYVDEKLEQLFIQTNFKLEQEEYAREEIGWTSIGFLDNIECVEMIEGKLGILDLLEEETKMSSENTLAWLENLRAKFDNSSNFKTSAESTADFTIHHFICPVHYNATEFTAKNYENAAKEQLEVFKESQIDLLNKLITDELSKMNVSKVKRTSGVRKRASFTSKPSRKTVTSELRTSLAVLATTLNKTKPFFVRCIKSNDQRKLFAFNAQCVAKQLRSYNIVETTKISAAGYFQQRCYKEFTQRYHCLSQFEDLQLGDKREVCQKILVQYAKNDDIKLGKTKVFLRQDTVDYLENARTEKRRNAAIVIQKSARRFLQRKRHNEICRAISRIQPYARGYLIRQWLQTVRASVNQQHAAATKIQTCFRGFLHRRRYQILRRRSRAEAHVEQVKRHLGRFNFQDMAATEIQKHVKSFLVRRRYERTLKNVIIVQSVVRRFLAMLKLKKLRAQNDLRSTVLNKSVERHLDSLRKKIDCLVSMHLSPEDLAAVHSIMDNQTCVQAKNRILNDLLLKKIKSLQDLGTNQQPYEIPQNPQPSTSKCCTNERCGMNWRLYDKPLAEEYNSEALYQKLLESFQKVDRDAKILQQTAGIQDDEILNLMESYRSTAQATKIADVTVSNIQQKEPLKDTEGSKESSQIQVADCPDSSVSASEQVQVSDLSLQMEDLRKDNQRKAEELFDLDEECKQRFLKKAHRLTMLVDEGESPKEDATVDVESSNEQASAGPSSQRLYLDGRGEPNKNAEYDGMFEFEFDLAKSVINHLTDIGPSSFIEFDQPTDLPAQILMMCIRYTDYKNDKQAALSLLSNFIETVKYIINNYGVFHLGAFWLLNTYRLLNYLKQYSKEDEDNQEFLQFYTNNTDRQNQQRLKNIDLRESWAALEEACGYLTDWVISEMKACNLALHSTTSLLQAERIYTFIETVPKETARKIDILLNELTKYHETLIKYGLDRRVIVQIFKPIFNHISTVNLNVILSRRELCSVTNGVHIRCNVRILERWALNRQLSSVIEELNPLIQALRLIQIQPVKRDDIATIQDDYNALNCDQIMKLLELYNEECLSRSYRKVTVSPRIIGKLKTSIEEREKLDQTVFGNVKEPREERPKQFPFRHSAAKLEQVEIPERYQLLMLKKI